MNHTFRRITSLESKIVHFRQNRNLNWTVPGGEPDSEVHEKSGHCGDRHDEHGSAEQFPPTRKRSSEFFGFFQLFCAGERRMIG